MVKKQMNRTRMVSKEAFLAYLTCPTQGWLTLRGKAGQPSAADQFRMEEGKDIHRRAQSLHPTGTFAGSVQRTRDLILDRRVRVIFEAAFSVDGFAARADWIRRTPKGWIIGEVKSSLHRPENLPAELIDDAAYTTMVLRRAGLAVVGVELIRLNPDWRLGMSDPELFGTLDISDPAGDRANEFLAHWEAAEKCLLRPRRPAAHWCFDCGRCPFFRSDCLGICLKTPIFDLPRLSEKRFVELTREGVQEISAIPDRFEPTDAQRQVATAIKRKAPQVNRQLLRAALATVEWPIGFLDFETVKTAVPLYPDVAPHEQLVTQYSLHVEASPGSELVHREYLADHTRDCREELAGKLVRDTAGCRTIVVYSSFEKTMIRGLANLLPTRAHELRGLEATLLDLEPVVRRGLVHPDFGGRSSIKVVLPVIAPELSYADLEIADGNAAMAAFSSLASDLWHTDHVREVRGALLEYCRLDTLAMSRLLSSLMSICDAPQR